MLRVEGRAQAEARTVEYRVDDGPWIPASAVHRSRDVRWAFRVDSPPGEHELVVRARADSGEQDEQRLRFLYWPDVRFKPTTPRGTEHFCVAEVNKPLRYEVEIETDRPISGAWARVNYDDGSEVVEPLLQLSDTDGLIRFGGDLRMPARQVDGVLRPVVALDSGTRFGRPIQLLVRPPMTPDQADAEAAVAREVTEMLAGKAADGDLDNTDVLEFLLVHPLVRQVSLVTDRTIAWISRSGLPFRVRSRGPRGS